MHDVKEKEKNTAVGAEDVMESVMIYSLAAPIHSNMQDTSIAHSRVLQRRQAALIMHRKDQEDALTSRLNLHVASVDYPTMIELLPSTTLRNGARIILSLIRRCVRQARSCPGVSNQPSVGPHPET